MSSEATQAPQSSSQYTQGDHDVPSSEDLGDAHIKNLLEEANELKQEGNDHFRLQSWNDALAVYRSALGRLPKRKSKIPRLNEDEDGKGKGKGKGRDTGDSDQEDEEEAKVETSESQGVVPKSESELTALECECAKARAVLNSNIGACYVKLGDHKEAAVACTEALQDDPVYVRALQRRAGSNEKIGSWSSLASAQEDYTKLLDLLPPNSSQLLETRRILQGLKPRVEAAQKKETDEMLDKLKGLGNNILGNFGLSTDNFKFTPNGQGGYSMNFVR